MSLFKRLTIIGVGLLGGSIGLALKERGWRGHIRGVGRQKSSLEKALAKGAIDEASLDIKTGVQDADLVVLSTPANLIIPILDEIRFLCETKTVVTDVASTKARICEHVWKSWPAPHRFVGSHPIAGSEKYGPENATSNLYEGSVVIIEKARNSHSPEAYQMVRQFWAMLGASVYEMEPAEHDAVLARTSHVPHVAASCLALLADMGRDVRPMLGGGFRDTTRIAAGNPAIWRDICVTNSEAIAAALREYANSLLTVADWVSQQNGDQLERFFTDARNARRRLLEE